MALTLTFVSDHAFHDGLTTKWEKKTVYDITFDSSYPTGGEPLTGDQVGVSGIKEAIPHGLARNAAGTQAVAVAYDHANKKLLAYETGAALSGVLAEVGNTESLANFSVRVTFIGNP